VPTTPPTCGRFHGSRGNRRRRWRRRRPTASSRGTLRTGKPAGARTVAGGRTRGGALAPPNPSRYARRRRVWRSGESPPRRLRAVACDVSWPFRRTGKPNRGRSDCARPGAPVCRPVREKAGGSAAAAFRRRRRPCICTVELYVSPHACCGPASCIRGAGASRRTSGAR